MGASTAAEGGLLHLATAVRVTMHSAQCDVDQKREKEKKEKRQKRGEREILEVIIMYYF